MSAAAEPLLLEGLKDSLSAAAHSFSASLAPGGGLSAGQAGRLSIINAFAEGALASQGSEAMTSRLAYGSGEVCIHENDACLFKAWLALLVCGYCLWNITMGSIRRARQYEPSLFLHLPT